MQIKIYNTFEDRCLEESWREIVDENDYFVQNSYEWCHIWWKHFQRKNRKLYIVTVFHKDRIVGIVPMFVETRFGFKQLRFIGNGLTDFHQFLIQKNFYENGVQAVLDHLKEFRKWDLVYLTQINDEDSLYKHLNNHGQARKKHLVGCPIIDIEGLSWDDYIGNIKSSNLRKDYKRKSHKLEREVEPSLIIIDEEQEVKAYIDELFRLHIERWFYKGEDSKFKHNDLQSFIMEVLPLLVKKERAIFYVLKAGDDLISYRLGFVQNRIFYDWSTSFDTEYTRYSPGKVMTGYVIKDLIGKNYRTFHFMRGDYDYKRQWMHKDREHVSNNYLFLLSNTNIRGKIIGNYYFVCRDIIKNRFESIVKNRLFRRVLRLERQ